MTQSNDTSPDKRFAPHPGNVVFHYEWNHSNEVHNAEGIPDSSKFIYYDAKGSETSDLSLATKRVPIMEVTTVSVDAAGKPVVPKDAAVISITEYGPDHRALRHTSARIPPHR